MLDIKECFCPNDRCKHYGLRWEGNLMKAGTYLRKFSGERKQMLKCRVCGYRFSETHNTIFAGCHYGEQTIRNIIVCISEGNGIRATECQMDELWSFVHKKNDRRGISSSAIWSNLGMGIARKRYSFDDLLFGWWPDAWKLQRVPYRIVVKGG